MSKGFSSSWRTALIVSVVVACFVGVMARLVFVQVVNRDELLRFITKARSELIVEKAKRGDILDTHGNPLAISRTELTLGVDPQSLRKEDEVQWPKLAKLIGMPLQDLGEVMKRRRASDENDKDGSPGKIVRYVKISDAIEESVNDEITKLNIKGVYATRHYKRAYPGNTLAAHLIGYVNSDGKPATGLEAYLDFYLRGQDGWCETEKDGHRRELAQFRSREVTASDGDTVVLTIDAVIQNMAEQELQAIGEKYHPKKATVIISDPATGALLALANYPTFNLNEYGKADPESQRNFAVSDLIEPGSTFKIVASSGALNEGLVTPDTKFNCGITSIEYTQRDPQPRLFVGKTRVVGLPREAPGDHFQDLTVTQIIGRSSNRGAAQLGMVLGEQKLYDYARAFGFGVKPGLAVGSAETPGMLEHPEKWDGLKITRMPMGHSIGASPLQIHFAMSTIANGGILMHPIIVKEIRNSEGALITTVNPTPVRRVVRPEVAQTMAHMLSTVMTEGTGRNAAIENYELAGKTGTTMKLVDGKYSEKNHVCSFVGFFPASHPRVMLSIIVDDGHLPTGAPGMAAVVAAPSFKRIGEQLIQYLDIKPTVEIQNAFVMNERGRR